MVFVGLSLVKTNSVSVQPQPRAFISTPVSVVDKLSDLPSLFNGVTWDEGQRIASPSAEYFVYASKDYLLHGLTGMLWTAKNKNIDKDKAYKLEKEFEDYYEKDLISSGWSRDITINRTRVTPIDAGGPTGKVWGYVISRNNNLRVVILSELFHPEAFPDLVLTVFVSDIVPTNTIVSD